MCYKGFLIHRNGSDALGGGLKRETKGFLLSFK